MCSLVCVGCDVSVPNEPGPAPAAKQAAPAVDKTPVVKEEPQADEEPVPEVESPVPVDPVPESPIRVDPTDFTLPGPRNLTVATGTLTLTDCNLDYTDITPDGASAPAVVILGHGFQRRMRHIVGLAEHIASFGLRVVAVDYCHSTFLDTDHEQNGLDAVALANALAPGTTPVIYAGQSAGGLSAMVAAAADPRTLAVIGLDLTDNNDVALNEAKTLLLPGLGLVGEPSSCNASGNGAAVFAALAGATRIKVTSASHCDFELPTTAVCTIPCGAQADDRSLVVRGLAAAFAAWKSGVDVTGEAWVSSNGSEFAALKAQGKVSTIP